ncbi:MAG: enoyl-CoA hydratase-related protein [Acidobacteria bacterium]|nr:enoyl-CoA hydratase-related protein [Acidobacteriota bacterium]
MNLQHVAVENDRVARITLRRPPLNVLNLEMLAELGQAFTSVSRDRPAVVVLAAEGKIFSAGVDIADHTEEKVGGMLELFHAIFRTMADLDAPVIALAQGAALGGGCELITACDLVVAAESARFGQPEIRVGAFPPVAAVELPMAMGPRRAAEMLFTGETLSAEEAAAGGLINQVFPDATFAADAAAYVELVSRHSGPVLAYTKEALRLGRGRTLQEALPDLETLYLDKLMKTQDAREGLKAFMEKRRPNFQDA